MAFGSITGQLLAAGAKLLLDTVPFNSGQFRAADVAEHSPLSPIDGSLAADGVTAGLDMLEDERCLVTSPDAQPFAISSFGRYFAACVAATD